MRHSERKAPHGADEIIRAAVAPLLQSAVANGRLSERSAIVTESLLIPRDASHRPTLEKIAAHHGISRERVRQITGSSLATLKAVFEEDRGSYPDIRKLLNWWRLTPVPLLATPAHEEVFWSLARIGLHDYPVGRVGNVDYWVRDDEELEVLREVVATAKKTALRRGAAHVSMVAPEASLLPNSDVRALLTGVPDVYFLDDCSEDGWFWSGLESRRPNRAVNAALKLFSVYSHLPCDLVVTQVRRALGRPPIADRARGTASPPALSAMLRAHPFFLVDDGDVLSLDKSRRPARITEQERLIAQMMAPDKALRRSEILEEVAPDREARYVKALSYSPLFRHAVESWSKEHRWGYYELAQPIDDMSMLG